MEQNNSGSYTTGEFAAHFGIKKDTLFYYDKIKLFCPCGVNANGIEPIQHHNWKLFGHCFHSVN